MSHNHRLPLLLFRGVILLLIGLNLQALTEQIARSAQDWTWRGSFRPGVFALLTVVWVVILARTFSSRWNQSHEWVEHKANWLAAWRKWNWMLLLMLIGLYLYSRLAPTAGLIQRFLPQFWLWGHLVLAGAFILWAAWPGPPIRRLLTSLLIGTALWQGVNLGLALQQALHAAQNPPRPPFVVAFFGGSITAGDGASDAETTSWRALTSTWLQEQYPQYEIISINAGLPGTGSDIGLARCQQDVLRHQPDLVLVEFAVNDSALNETLSLQSMEGIVRMIRASRPAPHIFFVYTTTREQSQAYAQDELPLAVQWHERVAQHYGIPTINAGLALWHEIELGRADWENLTVDGVHPTDHGYRIYFEMVRASLYGIPLNAERPPAHLPIPLVP